MHFDGTNVEDIIASAERQGWDDVTGLDIDGPEHDPATELCFHDGRGRFVVVPVERVEP